MATSRNAPGLIGKSDRLELRPPLPRVLPSWGKLVYLRVKRFADFTTSGVLLILLSPLLLVIALFIRLDSPGPVLFKRAPHGVSLAQPATIPVYVLQVPFDVS